MSSKMPKLPTQVHWHEGLFLQPHHLQALQRMPLAYAAWERWLAWPHPWGLVELARTPGALEASRLQVDRLVAVMPSGLVVSVPENAHVPSRNFEAELANASGPVTVRLGVPLWQRGRANSIETPGDGDARVNRVYRVVEEEAFDENSGESAQGSRVRRINARFLLPDDDDTDLETIDLFRVQRGVGQDGQPRIDGNFAPACLVLRGSGDLASLAGYLAEQVRSRRADLANRLGKSGFNLDSMRPSETGLLLRLRSLSRFAATLPALFAAPSTSPFEAYLALRELVGELAALRPGADLFEVRDYRHEDPLPAFQEIADRLKVLLEGGDDQTTKAIAFAVQDVILPGRPPWKALIAPLDADDLKRPIAYYLSATVSAGADLKEVSTLVQSTASFRFSPRTESHPRLGGRGIPLRERRDPPSALRTPPGTIYFEVARDEARESWEKVAREGAVGLWTPDEKLQRACTFALHLIYTA